MSHTALSAKKFLVVEDDDACRILIETILEDWGCSFETALNGQEAVEKVRRGGFDAVLMDVRMPVMNGYETTKAIRQTHTDLPIIAVTAHAMSWVGGKCQECGMSDYLTKPFESRQLEDILRKWTCPGT